MKNFEISVKQERVNSPEGREVWNYILVKDANDYVHIVREEKADEWPESLGFHHVAKVSVNAPAVMAGSLEEIEADFREIIKESAVKEGICEADEAGNLWAI